MRDPKQNGIQQIRIRNFKVFREPKPFDVRGRHVLVYGPNGSGKSSLYWALYTLLQAITKQVGNTDKYFEYEGDESLLNIHEPDGAASFIEIDACIAGSAQAARLDPQGLHIDGVQQGTGALPAWFEDLTLAAEFINHRQLIGFYSFANSEPIDLLPAFEDGFYPFLRGEVHFKTTSLKAALGAIESELARTTRLYQSRKQRLDDGPLKQLNEEFGLLVVFVNQYVNEFLTNNFPGSAVKVKLDPQGAYRIEKQGRKWIVLRPKLKLSIEQLKEDGATYHPVDRPQSFLNEAMLTRIGVAIRFTLLLRRPQGLPMKVMLMDDLLISLDMDNRAKLIETIERHYQDDYQLFIFTHDRGLYNELRRKVGDDVNNWAVYEVQNNEFKDGKNELEKAQAFLAVGDYDACALELRKMSEILLRQYLIGIDPTIFDDKEFRSLGNMIELAYKSINEKSLKRFEERIIELGLTGEDLTLLKQEDFTGFMQKPISQNQKMKVLKARSALFELADNASEENRRALNFLKKVKRIKDQILNIGAHPTDEPIYRTEMEEAVQSFERFKEILFAAS